MKFFKPKVVNKQPVNGFKVPFTASPPPVLQPLAFEPNDKALVEQHSAEKLLSPHPSPQQQQEQQQQEQQPELAQLFDAIDASNVQPELLTIVKESEAPPALISLRIGAQQQQVNCKQIPTVVDLDDDASGKSSDGEEADDECEDDAGEPSAAVKVAATNAADSSAAVEKKSALATLFQRKRPAHQLQQQQQPQQQQQQGRRSTPCGGLRNMKMRDLIYWCPKDQPPPKWRRESSQATEPEIPTSANPSQQQQAAPQPQQEPAVKSESSASRLVPQVMLDSRGNIVLNEESLYIRESAPAIVEEVREDCAELRATYRSFRTSGGRGSAARGRQWSYKETLRFYKAVSTIGTDFSYMASLFKGRSREELKRKYKREEKANPHLIDQMLKKRKPYDLSMFEPSSESDNELDDGKSACSSSQGNAKGGGSCGQAGKPSDIVMEGLKRHLQANQLKNGRGNWSTLLQQQQQPPPKPQPDPAVSIVIC